jgi:hypothetical protein
MAIKPYYTSNTLIDAVKRKMSMPISQVTYSNEDILRFTDEELMLAQVPSILQYHEEYLVYLQDVPLVANKSKYPVPNRAIGMRLRDLFYKDTQGQLIEMSRISPDDKSFFEVSSSGNNTPSHFYVENNNIVIVPKIGASPVGQLQFSYYLRPNSLVPDEKAAISSSFSKNVTVSNASLIAGDTLKIGTLSLVAGTTFAIGATNSATASNIAVYLNNLGNPDLTAATNSAIVTLVYADRNLSVSSNNSAALAIQSSITVNSAAVPEEIVSGMLVDILQTDAGHSTLSFDVRLGANSVSATSITFTESQLPQEFVAGDYVCLQYECIIPQIPTDLHNLLAERTCARILEAQGDAAGLQAANAKIKELENGQNIIIDNRVEGSPMKVFNRNGLLRNGRNGYRGNRS